MEVLLLAQLYAIAFRSENFVDVCSGGGEREPPGKQPKGDEVTANLGGKRAERMVSAQGSEVGIAESSRAPTLQQKEGLRSPLARSSLAPRSHKSEEDDVRWYSSRRTRCLHIRWQMCEMHVYCGICD